MQNFARAVSGHFGLDLFEAGDEARVAHELRYDGMIRMPSVQRVGDDDRRLQRSDHYRDFGARLRSVLNAPVREPKILTHRDAHHFRCLTRFLRAELRCAATRQLARGEIENARGSAQHLRGDESAAANQLDVIGVGPDRQDVDVFHARKLPAPSRRGYFPGKRLLVPQSGYRVELRRSLRGKNPEYESYAHRDYHGYDRESNRDRGVDLHRQRRQPAEGQADENAEHTTQARERRRLDEELKEDLPLRRAERLPDADLARSARHRDHHDRHNPDAADKQSHAR